MSADATPSPLEALLKEVEALQFQSRLPDPRQLAEGQTRLAAIVRVLREATEKMLEADCFMDACAVQATALRRADEIAGGK